MAQFGSTVSEEPMKDFVALTPADGTTFRATYAIWVGTGGDLVVKDANGDQCTFKNVPDGKDLRLAITALMEASTAGDVVALYL
jgi:hypothetical protein